MARLDLLDFQQEATDQLIASAINYYDVGPDKLDHRPVPFVGQLKAVTGAGKTPILCKVVGSLNPSIILWTTKFGSVVDQTVSNLNVGGKYHHLLGRGPVEVVKFSDIHSSAEWHHILNRTDGVTILVSTVAVWNSAEKDERLNVHRMNSDWGDISRWEQLKTQRQRPLWIVYDEAHNTTTEQIELLIDLLPAGFFVASASQMKGKLQHYLTSLSEETRKQRIVSVSTRAVVDAQLLKSTISLADYESSVEEMVADVVKRRESLEQKLRENRSYITPKAIYVVETSNIAGSNEEPRPVAIWKTLVGSCGVHPEAIAVCTNTKSLPKDAIRVETIDKLSDEYTHIIFNKKLQEGWDDPSVYVCYFDGRTDSPIRIQQVLGRALRQPNAAHFRDEDLNTAFFFVNCPNEVLEKIIDGLKEELRIYKDGDDSDDFEPVRIKDERKTPPEIALKDIWLERLNVPYLQLELPIADLLQNIIEKEIYDFSEDDRAAPGRAIVNIVAVRTGTVLQNTRNLMEDMRVQCGVYLRDQIRVKSKNCVSTIHPRVFSDEKLKKTACYKSKALHHYSELASKVVQEYENHVQLQLRKDFDPGDGWYQVKSYQPSNSIKREFENAAHPYYDSRAFANEDEYTVARALDKFSGSVWIRNRDRVGYGIPLPIKSESSSTFYPDFLWWVNETIWAIDPTGSFLMNEKIHKKLLYIPPPIKVALINHRKQTKNDDSWILVYHRWGNVSQETFNSIEELVKTIIANS